MSLLRKVFTPLAKGVGRRAFTTTRSTAFRFARPALFAGGLALSAGVVASSVSAAEKVDYAEVRKAIESILEQPSHDDGHLGPLFVRLAWHASGTYDKDDRTGGSNGGTMRFSPEKDWGANNGLGNARDILEHVKAKFPGISYGDLWTLAAVVSLEDMRGPKVDWRPGRKDFDGLNFQHGATKKGIDNGGLPDAAQGAQHLRDVFYRMGFNDQEIVALSGAHTLGRCHTTSSGFTGPWTRSPTTFSNLYFQELLHNKWTVKKWKGPKQFEDPSGDLMMLPTDMALLEDPTFRKWVEIYAQDEDRFSKDFSNVFGRLLHLGVPAQEGGYAPLVALAALLAAAKVTK